MMLSYNDLHYQGLEVWKAYMSGKVLLTQRKGSDGKYEYWATKRAKEGLSNPEASGPDLLDMILPVNTLDVLLDRDPRAVPLTEEELMSLVTSERAARAALTSSKRLGKLKKQGVEE